jgi:hypothetical protein
LAFFGTDPLHTKEADEFVEFQILHRHLGISSGETHVRDLLQTLTPDLTTLAEDPGRPSRDGAMDDRDLPVPYPRQFQTHKTKVGLGKSRVSRHYLP